MISRFSKEIPAVLTVLVWCGSTVFAADPLPSWNDGQTKQSIITFVEKVTKKGSPDFVPDRIKALAPQHPEWQTNEPFASILKGDVKGGFAGGDRAILDLMMASHT